MNERHETLDLFISSLRQHKKVKLLINYLRRFKNLEALLFLQFEILSLAFIYIYENIFKMYIFFCFRMVRMIGDEFLTEERDRKYYADHYTCFPPPLFIILITLVEVSKNEPSFTLYRLPGAILHIINHLSTYI